MTNPYRRRPIAPSLLAAAVAAAGTASAAHYRDPLGGKWTATVTPDEEAAKDGAKEYADTYTFKAGKFTSDTLKKDGFDPADVNDNSSPVANLGKFDVTLKNKDGDTAKWTGETVGGELTGTLVVTKKDGTTKTYNFKAKKA